MGSFGTFTNACTLVVAFHSLNMWSVMDGAVVVRVHRSILPLCIVAVAHAVALTFLRSKPVHCRVGTYSPTFARTFAMR